MKTIGVLTSGGDAPGMNAAIRAVVRSAVQSGMRVLGIRRGWNGLMYGDMYEMNLRSVSNILNRGGTILYSARSPGFKEEAGIEKAVAVCREVSMDGVVVIGGDGSFRGARDLSQLGVPCVCIPGTIDNDIACSDYSIGFDTATNTVMEMVDRLRDTSESHDRCSVVEVMGRHTGHIALSAGIAVGATTILIPEIPFDFEADVVKRMKKTQLTGKRHFIVVVAEGVGGVYEMATRIEREMGVVARATILGHVQRGGSPTARDRVAASIMGCHAVEMLKRGAGNRVVAIKKNAVVDFDIIEALKMKKAIDPDLFRMAHEISI